MAAELTDTRRWGTIWITGASSGIGRELSLLLDKEGTYLAVSARSVQKLNELEISSKTIFSHPLDVSNQKELSQGVQEIEAAGGPIDLAILNAGGWTMMDATNMDVQAIRTGVEVNYMGVVYALDALLPGMLQRKRGHIAIVASVAGYRGLPRSMAYGPTKAALINLAETLKVELAPHGIIVTLINPGFVDTALTQDNPFPMPALMTAESAAQRIVAGLMDEKYEIVFPRRFVYAIKLLRILPNALFFWIVRKFIWKR